MRILHLSSLYHPYRFGGAERVVQALAEGAAAAGASVAVAHLVPKRSPDFTHNEVEVFPLAHRNPLWIETSKRYPGLVRNVNKVATLFNVLTARDAADVIDRYAPDIVHTHSMTELTPWIWKRARERGKTIVHTLQDYDLLCIRGALFKDGRRCDKRHAACVLFSEVKRRYHTMIDHVVGISETVLDAHLERGFFEHLPPSRRQVVWNPVHEGVVEAGRRRDGGPLRFGFLGRLVEEKGIDLLLAACRQLPREGWTLTIGGRAPGGDDDLRRRSEGLPITFAGFVETIRFLSDIDVLVAPVLWAEPFGLTIVEALAAGVPVIGSRLGGVGEILRDVEPGWLFPPGDVAALVALMREMIACPPAPPAASPGYRSVMERTDRTHAIGRYLDLYRSVVAPVAATG